MKSNSRRERLELIQADNRFFGSTFAIVDDDPAIPRTIEEIEAEIARVMVQRPERQPIRKRRRAA